MSWYLANEDGMIDQFASVSGLAELRGASQAHPALKDFFEAGETRDVSTCIAELGTVAKAGDEDVRDTAEGLAKLMHGQTSVHVTQGFGSDS